MWVRVPPPSLPRKGLLWLCERLKGNMRRELRNEKSPFNCTDFASRNLRIYNVFPTFHADTPDEKRFVQGTCVPVLTCEGKCSCWRAKPAHFVGHLPGCTTANAILASISPTKWTPLALLRHLVYAECESPIQGN